MLINIIRIILLLIFIISIFLIICMKPKYDINEYLVCSVGKNSLEKETINILEMPKISYPVLINYQAVKDFFVSHIKK